MDPANKGEAPVLSSKAFDFSDVRSGIHPPAVRSPRERVTLMRLELESKGYKLVSRSARALVSARQRRVCRLAGPGDRRAIRGYHGHVILALRAVRQFGTILEPRRESAFGLLLPYDERDLLRLAANAVYKKSKQATDIVNKRVKILQMPPANRDETWYQMGLEEVRDDGVAIQVSSVRATLLLTWTVKCSGTAIT
jgi:hypothetical protein